MYLVPTSSLSFARLSQGVLRYFGWLLSAAVVIASLLTLTVTLSDCQVVEDGYEFFAKRQLVTLFSAPNYCGEFDNAGALMSVDETLMCSFQILKVSAECRQVGCRRAARSSGRVRVHARAGAFVVPAVACVRCVAGWQSSKSAVSGLGRARAPRATRTRSRPVAVHVRSPGRPACACLSAPACLPDTPRVSLRCLRLSPAALACVLVC